MEQTQVQVIASTSGQESLVTVRDFAAFYLATRPAVYRAVLLRIRSAETAEDACHEAYARALAHWEQLASHPNPKAWVAPRRT